MRSVWESLFSARSKKVLRNEDSGDSSDERKKRNGINVYHKHNFANVESTIFRFKKKKVIELNT